LSSRATTALTAGISHPISSQLAASGNHARATVMISPLSTACSGGGATTLAVYGYVRMTSIGHPHGHFCRVRVVHRALGGDKLATVTPLALALIDSVFALALHHDERAKVSMLSDHESASVWAAVSGPERDGPVPGSLLIRVSVKLVPRDPARPGLDESVHVHLDLQEQRLLARELLLAELPLDRSGLARMIGELEAWCYARVPIFQLDRVGDAEV
jgi:hypothetical protein